MEVLLQLFITSVLDGNTQLHASAALPKTKIILYKWIGGRVDFKFVLDFEEVK